MANDDIRRILEAQETVRHQLKPLSEILRNLHGSLALQQLGKDLDRHQALMRTAFGPLEDLRRAGLLISESPLGKDLQRMRDIAAAMEKAFHLPEIDEATKLLRQFESLGTSNSMVRYQCQTSEIVRAMESIRAPWLDTADKLRSIGGFAGLQSIGHALRTMPSFDRRLTDALRIDLGDWREKVAWPVDIFDDPLARASFYCERGLDPTLTAFPARAFEQSIVVAELKEPFPLLVEAYNLEREGEEHETEVAFERNNTAHDRLQRFESQVRNFIDERMTAVFGADWIKHQVSGSIREEWLAKRQKALDGGEPESPLIAYADFSDYVPIIVRKDNWQHVFKPFFCRKESVQESFQRLYPIRICTMHSRLITQDDELFLYVETKRLLAAIRASN